MAYKKSGYRKMYTPKKRRTWKKKRTFKAKRVAKKMDNKIITKKVAFTQSFSLNNNSGGATPNVPFLIDLLGTSGGGGAPVVNNFYISLAQV